VITPRLFALVSRPRAALLIVATSEGGLVRRRPSEQSLAQRRSQSQDLYQEVLLCFATPLNNLFSLYLTHVGLANARPRAQSGPVPTEPR
jgi:hypothetical protein